MNWTRQAYANFNTGEYKILAANVLFANSWFNNGGIPPDPLQIDAQGLNFSLDTPPAYEAIPATDLSGVIGPMSPFNTALFAQYAGGSCTAIMEIEINFDGAADQNVFGVEIDAFPGTREILLSIGLNPGYAADILPFPNDGSLILATNLSQDVVLRFPYRSDNKVQVAFQYSFDTLQYYFSVNGGPVIATSNFEDLSPQSDPVFGNPLWEWWWGLLSGSNPAAPQYWVKFVAFYGRSSTGAPVPLSLLPTLSNVGFIPPFNLAASSLLIGSGPNAPQIITDVGKIKRTITGSRQTYRGQPWGWRT